MGTREAYDTTKKALAELRQSKLDPITKTIKFTFQPYAASDGGFWILRADELPHVENLPYEQLDEDWLFCEEMLQICNRMKLDKPAHEFRERMSLVEARKRRDSI